MPEVGAKLGGESLVRVPIQDGTGTKGGCSKNQRCFVPQSCSPILLFFGGFPSISGRT